MNTEHTGKQIVPFSSLGNGWFFCFPEPDDKSRGMLCQKLGDKIKVVSKKEWKEFADIPFWMQTAAVMVLGGDALNAALTAVELFQEEKRKNEKMHQTLSAVFIALQNGDIERAKALIADCPENTA